MTDAPNRGVLTLAVGAALLSHGLLFALTRTKPAAALVGAPVPPATSYLAGDGAKLPMSSASVRMVRSPVIFSLPSSLGFSRELLEQKVQTPRFVLRQNEPERFLEVAPVQDEAGLDAAGLMLTSTIAPSPAVPSNVFESPTKKPASRRVTLAPELKERVVGGVVLPTGLNQDTEKPWEATASVSVSEDGFVEHVFLDRPLDPPALNAKVLQLMYGLRFKPGAPIEGSVEIYSPESAPKKVEESKP